MVSKVIRIVYLDENTTEEPLKTFIQGYTSPSGLIENLYVRKDEQLQFVFAYVVFQYNEDAKKAADRLNGFYYQAQYLEVELIGPNLKCKCYIQESDDTPINKVPFRIRKVGNISPVNVDGTTLKFEPRLNRLPPRLRKHTADPIEEHPLNIFYAKPKSGVDNGQSFPASTSNRSQQKLGNRFKDSPEKQKISDHKLGKKNVKPNYGVNNGQSSTASTINRPDQRLKNLFKEAPEKRNISEHKLGETNVKPNSGVNNRQSPVASTINRSNRRLGNTFEEYPEKRNISENKLGETNVKPKSVVNNNLPLHQLLTDQIEG